jgi:hypothetical protein
MMVLSGGVISLRCPGSMAVDYYFTIIQYAVLQEDAREIQTMTLHPKIKFSDEPRCDLQNTGLDNLPLYEAIYYPWGDPVCNGWLHRKQRWLLSKYEWVDTVM